MDSFSEQCASLPWALKLEKSYKRFQKEQMKENSHELLAHFITRSVKVTLLEVKDYRSTEDVQPQISFMEKLIYTFNEENAKLPMVLPDFDHKVLSVMEKYLEVLVFQSQKNNSSQQSMLKLTQFLKSLPCHPSLKISNGARCKTLLTQLLTNHQRKSKFREADTQVTDKPPLKGNSNSASSSDESLKTEERRVNESAANKSESDEHADDSELSTCSNPPKGSHPNDINENTMNNNFRDDSSEEFSPSKTKPVLNSTSLRNETVADNENNEPSISEDRSTKSSSEDDDSSHEQCPPSPNKLVKASTHLPNDAQTGVTVNYSVSKKRTADNSTTIEDQIPDEGDDEGDSPCVSVEESASRDSKETESSEEESPSPRRKSPRISSPSSVEMETAEETPTSPKEKGKKSSDEIVSSDEENVSSEMKSSQVSKTKIADSNSSDEAVSSEEEDPPSKGTSVSVSSSHRKQIKTVPKIQTNDESMEGIESSEEREFLIQKLVATSTSKMKMNIGKHCDSPITGKQMKKHLDETDSSEEEFFFSSKKLARPSLSSRKQIKTDDRDGASDSKKRTAKKNVDEADSSDPPKKKTARTSLSIGKQTKTGDKRGASVTKNRRKKIYLSETDSSGEEYLPPVKKNSRRSLPSRKQTKKDKKAHFSETEYQPKKKILEETDLSDEERFSPKKKHIHSSASSKRRHTVDDSSDFEKDIVNSSSEIETSEEKNPSIRSKKSSHASSLSKSQIRPTKLVKNDSVESDIDDSFTNLVQSTESKHCDKKSSSTKTKSTKSKSSTSTTDSLSKSGLAIPSDDKLIDHSSSSTRRKGNSRDQQKEAKALQSKPDLTRKNRRSSERIPIKSELPLTSPPNFDLTTLYVQPKVKSSLPLTHLQMILRRRFRNPFITLTEKQRNYNVLRLLTTKRKFTRPSWDITKRERSLANVSSGISDSISDSKALQNVTGLSTTGKLKPEENSPDLFSNCGRVPGGNADASSTNDNLTELQKNMIDNIFGCEASTSDVELMEEMKSNAQLWSNVELNSQELGNSFNSRNELTQTTDNAEANTGRRHKLSLSKNSDPAENKENRKISRPALNIIYTQQTGLKRKAVNLESPLGSPSASLSIRDEEMSSPPKKKALIQSKMTTSLSNATLKTTWETLGKMLPPCWLKILQDHVQAHNPLDGIPYEEHINQPMPLALLCGCVKLTTSETK